MEEIETYTSKLSKQEILDFLAKLEMLAWDTIQFAEEQLNLTLGDIPPIELQRLHAEWLLLNSINRHLEDAEPGEEFSIEDGDTFLNSIHYRAASFFGEEPPYDKKEFQEYYDEIGKTLSTFLKELGEPEKDKEEEE